MGLADFADKAKGLLDGHEDQASDALEKARQAAKDRMPDQGDGAVDSAADKAKEYLDNNRGSAAGE